MRFVWFCYYKTANRATLLLKCGALLLAVSLSHFADDYGMVFAVW